MFEHVDVISLLLFIRLQPSNLTVCRAMIATAWVPLIVVSTLCLAPTERLLGVSIYQPRVCLMNAAPLFAMAVSTSMLGCPQQAGPKVPFRNPLCNQRTRRAIQAPRIASLLVPRHSLAAPSIQSATESDISERESQGSPGRESEP